MLSGYYHVTMSSALRSNVRCGKNVQNWRKIVDKTRTQRGRFNQSRKSRKTKALCIELSGVACYNRSTNKLTKGATKRMTNEVNIKKNEEVQ